MDIETSGLFPEKCGIWQIGAIDSDNPENYFIEECRIDEEDEVGKGAIFVTGKTEEYFRDEKKQSCRELLVNFFKWCENAKTKNCLCQNPQFDLGFISIKARKYSLEVPFHHRAFDLHSIAQEKYYQIHNTFLLKNNASDMNLTNTLNFCGIKDDRRSVEKDKITVQGKEHNALEDCKLTGECFSRILYGKGLFEEFNKFDIPEYLR